MDQQINNDVPTQQTQAPEVGAGPQPGQYAPPAGMRLVKEDDWSAAQRWKQQYEGSKPLVDAAIKRGFKDPDAFTKLDRVSGVLQKHGLDFDQMGGLLEGAWGGADEKQDAKAGGFDPDLLKSSGFLTRDDYEQGISKMRAEITHESATKAERQVLDALKTDLLKMADDDRMKFLVEGAFDNAVNGKRSLYPEGHPLRDIDVKPFEEKELRSIYDEVVKKIKIEEAKDAAEVGKAAATQTRTVKQPSASPGGHGKPDQNSTRQSARDLVDQAASRLPKRGRPVGT